MKAFLRLIPLTFLCAIIPVLKVAGQATLSGLITDSSGSPVPYATVYIQEIQHGTTANAMGKYEIRLDPGTYTVFYQSLGYNQDFRQVSISSTPVVRDVSLTIQYFQIPEVTVSSGREDPAYAIMRKAIARAPYYLNAVQHYKAMVYLKGTAIIDRMPRLLTNAIKVESDVSVKVWEKYLLESQNEIEFNAPDKYVHRLIAIQSSFPSESDQVSPMNFIQASFYEPVIAGLAVSPLAQNAFSHYRFSYEGASLQGQYVINKIRVIPKRKSQQVFEGTLYIIEDLWCIHSLDLVNENIVGKIRVRQLHTPVQDNFWIPVSHNFDVDFSMIGVKGRGTYASSVRYSEIVTGSSLPVIQGQPPAAVTNEIIEDTLPPSKTAIEIEKLLSKQELSNRDMVRLSKLLEKEAAASDTTADGKKDLEIKVSTEYIIEENAAGKSADYWENIRPIPLADDEIKSLMSTDSLRTTLKEVSPRRDTLTITVGAGRSPIGPAAGDVLFGKTWRADSNRISFNFGGLAKLDNISFNSVDGLKYKIDLRLNRHWRKGTSFSLYPSAGYAFSRESLFWTISSTYNYRTTNEGYFWVRAGDITADCSDYGRVNNLLNSFSSLFLKDNILRLYRSRYVGAGHRSEISNGIYLEVSTRLESRTVVGNSTDFSFFRRDIPYDVNIPVNELVDQSSHPAYMPADHNHLEVTGELTIIPFQRYRIIDGKKYPEGSDYPAFNVSFTQGYNRASVASSSFSRLVISATRQKSTGPMAELYWKLRAGSNFTQDSISFQDFIHFNTQPFPVLINNYRDAFFLPGWYARSTDKWFAEAHLKYTNPYLLLKCLPGISKTLMRENLHLRYLVTSQTRHYLEAGYSISEIFLLGEMGIFAGFEDFRFRSAGVRLVLNLN
jgi:hypothetical protein